MGNMTLSQEQAFLTDICANPEDDGVRLIYADWLTERDGLGDSERAEFIRVQCQSQHLPPCTCSYGRMLTSCRRCPALLRELRLRAEVQDRLRDEWRSWADEQNGPSPWWEDFQVRRGFVEHITLPAEDWCRYAERLRATQPIREVTLTTRFNIRIGKAPPGPLAALVNVGFYVRGDAVPFYTLSEAAWMHSRFDPQPGSGQSYATHAALQFWPGITFHGPDFPEGNV
jgi:uncharacterized protein (TIGR02996 family)